MVTFKDSIYLQLNWQSTLLMPSWRAAVLGHLGTPAQLTGGRAATTQTQHEGWAEPCQVENPAQTNSGFLLGVLSCPHTAAVVPAPGTVGGTMALRGTPVPLGSGLSPRPEAVPGSQPSSWWSQSDILSKPRSLPSLPHPPQEWEIKAFKERKRWYRTKLWHKAGYLFHTCHQQTPCRGGTSL